MLHKQPLKPHKHRTSNSQRDKDKPNIEETKNPHKLSAYGGSSCF